MKTVNREDLTDGLLFHSIYVRVGDCGIDLVVGDEYVVKKSGIRPCSGCDFNSSSNSLSSSSFYENNIEEGLNELFSTVKFSLSNYKAAKAFCYCLPENLKRAKAGMLSRMKIELREMVGCLETDLKRFNSILGAQA